MRLRRFVTIAAALVAVITLVRPTSAAKVPTTNLLFPYLTNQSGFDTLFTISNTGADPFGTTSAGGTCVITFYSGGVGTPIIIPGALLPGQTATFLLSVIKPGFAGYAIAHCEIAFAHGISRLSDLGTRNFAASYPALVLPAKRAKTDERLND